MFDKDQSHSVFGDSIRKVCHQNYYGFNENELRQTIKTGKTIIAEFSENALAYYKPYTCTASMYKIGIWLNFGIGKEPYQIHHA